MTTLSNGETLIMVVFIGSAGALFLLIFIWDSLRRFIAKRKWEKMKQKIDLTSDRIRYFGNITVDLLNNIENNKPKED